MENGYNELILNLKEAEQKVRKEFNLKKPYPIEFLDNEYFTYVDTTLWIGEYNTNFLIGCGTMYLPDKILEKKVFGDYTIFLLQGHSIYEVQYKVFKTNHEVFLEKD